MVKRALFSTLAKLAVLITATGLLGGALLFAYFVKDFPRPERFTEREFFQTTEIYDRTGEVLLYNVFGEEKRTLIPLDDIPEHMKAAALSAEDSDFYNHSGIDLRGIGRSIMVNLRLGSPSQGGSTISQQLIRSSFLTTEKTVTRKLREIVLTLELERRYGKEQILEWYLNQVPFGSNAYGIEAAAETFFTKQAHELTIAESALLTSLIQLPSYLSPYGSHTDELFARQRWVISRMLDEGYITQEEHDAALEEELEFKEIKNPIKAPHFTLYVRDLLVEEFGEEFLQQKGLRVYTTLDWELQQQAESMVDRYVQGNQGYRSHNAGLVAIDPKRGEILSLIGSQDWFGDSYPEDCIPGKDCLFDPQVNVATSFPGRQPGSAFKPIVYATAFENGYSDETVVVDELTNFGIWGGEEYIPQNYDGLFRGPVTLRQALSQSLNVPAVKVLNDLAGIEQSIKTAQSMGITTLDKPASFYGLSLVLGGGEVRLLDLTSAYGVFANDGKYVAPHAMLRIEDTSGNVIRRYDAGVPRRVISSRTARLISDILSDNDSRSAVFGPSSPLFINQFPVAAKTGTTNDFKDAWTVGFTPSLAVGVWAGNNDNSPTARQPGVVLAAPLWNEFFIASSSLYQPEPFRDVELVTR